MAQNQTPEDDMAAQLLLKEVEESMQQEKLQAIWNEWGATIIGVACMIIFGTMIGVGWQSWRTNVHETQTEILINSQSQDTQIDGVDSLSGDYKGIAALMFGAVVATQDGTDTIYNQLMRDAIDAGMSHEWDIMAKLNALRSKTTSPDADINKIADDMMDLASKRGNPYEPLILVEVAMLKQQSGDTNAALDILGQAKNHKLSADSPLREKITRLINLYQSLSTESNNE